MSTGPMADTIRTVSVRAFVSARARPAAATHKDRLIPDEQQISTGMSFRMKAAADSAASRKSHRELSPPSDKGNRHRISCRGKAAKGSLSASSMMASMPAANNGRASCRSPTLPTHNGYSATLRIGSIRITTRLTRPPPTDCDFRIRAARGSDAMRGYADLCETTTSSHWLRSVSSGNSAPVLARGNKTTCDNSWGQPPSTVKITFSATA